MGFWKEKSRSTLLEFPRKMNSRLKRIHQWLCGMVAVMFMTGDAMSWFNLPEKDLVYVAANANGKLLPAQEVGLCEKEGDEDVPKLIQFLPEVQITLLNSQAASKLLSKPDDFVRTMSSFDKSSRLKKTGKVSEAEYLKFVERQTREFTVEESRRLQGILKDIQPSLRQFRLPWPKKIFLAKTTGLEEGNAAYTRGNVIVFPGSKLRQKDQGLKRLLVHELFHVLSRANPKLGTKLYRIIGYEPSPLLEFPAELASRKLSNPDAPFNQLAIEVIYNGEKVKATPVLYSRAEKYDEKMGGTFFRYLVFRLLVLNGKDLSKARRDADGKLILLEPKEAIGFRKKIGSNTGYIIHPEETMADNFVFLVLGKKNLPNPEIVQSMRDVFLKAGH